MLAGINGYQLTMNVLLIGAHIQTSAFCPVFTLGR
jgi:hypothetical protein